MGLMLLVATLITALALSLWALREALEERAKRLRHTQALASFTALLESPAVGLDATIARARSAIRALELKPLAALTAGDIESLADLVEIEADLRLARDEAVAAGLLPLAPTRPSLRSPSQP